MKNRKKYLFALTLAGLCWAAFGLLPTAGARWQGARQDGLKREADHLSTPPLRADLPRNRQDGERREEASSHEESAGAEAYDRLRRLPAGMSEVPVERLLAAREQMKRMPRHSTAGARGASINAERESAAELQGAWEPLGPGNIGGRTRALLVHPTNPQVMYAAGAGGGVWKTVNGGASWSPLADLLPSLAVCALAFDPLNPDTVYAGTGEGFFNGGARRGAGVFKSTDGGASWAQLAGTRTADFHYVNDLVVSRKNGLRLYAATGTGVWRSADGGASWSRVLDPKLNGGCLDLAARTDLTTDYVFASCGLFAGATVYRSKDAGGDAAWEQVLSNYAMGRTSLALAPSNQNVVYALAAAALSAGNENSGGLFAVFRSTSGGDAGTWAERARAGDATKLNRVLLSNTLAAFAGECRIGASYLAGQGWYSNVVAVDPANENRVWAGGADLFRSDDGGANWGLASYSWAERGHPAYVHSEQHAIAFHPQYDGAANKTLFVANDGGVYKTADATADAATGAAGPCSPGNTKIAWQSLNNGYGVTQFFQGAPFPDGASYLGGTLGAGTLVGSDAAGADGWREVMGGSGGYVAVDPTNPAVIYAMQPGLAVRKSTDGGATFANASLGLRDEGLYVTPLVLDPNNPRRLWTGGAKLYRTDSGAARWDEMSSPVSGRVSTIAVAPTDSNLVLFGSSTGTIYRREEGVSTVLTSAAPRQGFVSRLAFDPANRNVAYATYSTYGGTHVWKTTDGGASWFGLDGAGAGALPDVPVHCIVVDPADARRLYIGTDLGVFATADGGGNWAVENAGFANVPVESLVLNTVGGQTTLYAFTHGRGAWRVPLGAGCRVALASPGQSFGAEGGAGNIQVVSEPQGCAALAAEVNPSGAGWLTVTGVSGSAVSFAVAPNNSTRTRGGTVAVAGRSFTVTQAGRADTSAPVVTITSHPTGAPLRVSHSPYETFSLKGTATDDDRVVSLTWFNDRYEDPSRAEFPPYEHGIFGDQNPWTATSIYLRPGVNNLTITARDAAGNKSSARLTVINYPEFGIRTVAGLRDRPGYAGDGGPGAAAKFAAPSDVALDGEGNLYVADFGNHCVRKLDARTGIITTVAGVGPDAQGGGGFSGDGGPATAAKLNLPNGVALDKAGNLYIADRDNSRVRRVRPDGIIETIAGSGRNVLGALDGPALEVTIGRPTHILPDEKGGLYIADPMYNRVCRLDLNAGTITTVAGDNMGGRPGATGDGGPASAARLSSPYRLALDKAGNLYVADFGNGRLRKIEAATGRISTVRQLHASSLAIGGADTVYYGNTNYLYSLSPGGEARQIASSQGYDPNDEGKRADRAYLLMVEGLVVEPSGSLVFADRGTQLVRRLFRLSDTEPPTITISAPAGGAALTTAAGRIDLSGTAADNLEVTHITWSNDRGGSGVAGGTTNWSVKDLPLLAGVNNITLTAWDGLGNAASRTLRVVSNPAATFVTVAGDPSWAGADYANILNGNFGGDGGQATRARLNYPAGVAVDRAGNLYVADYWNNRVRKVTRAGVITTLAGSGAVGSSGDGGPATLAALNGPTGVAVSAAGDVYFSDTHNRRVRKVDASGVITTVAGTGAEGSGGDGAPATAARLAYPIGLALDAAGNLYIADAWSHRVRKVNLASGVITTAAGSGYGFAGDGGPAVDALLNYPAGVAVDAAGNLFINDMSNRRLRRVSAATGVITTVAGGGASDDGGDGGPATSKVISPSGSPAVDAAGNVYFADGLRVRKLSPDGTLSTVAGGYAPYPQTAVGDGAAALSALFSYGASLAADAAGNLYVTDSANHRVVAVTPYRAATTGSAASYDAGAVADGSIVSVFGTHLAAETRPAPSLPLPTELAGTTVRVRDSAGVERLAPLFFVSPFQINYQIPPGTAAGMATVIVTNASGAVSTGPAPVVAVAPGLFSADSTGAGLAAALALRVRSDGSRRYEPVAVFDPGQQRIVPAPVDLGPATDQVYLELYGTGIRGLGAHSQVSATVGGVSAPVLYAGAQGAWVGLDQVNVLLPRELAGRGEVSVVLKVDGKAANTVTVWVR